MINPFARRVRGFRVVDLALLTLLVSVIVGVYLAKTFAGRERSEIAKIERKIDGERARIRLLNAEVAHLEQPGRIERLSSTYLGLKPVSAKNEASVDQLALLARNGAPAKAVAPSPIAVAYDDPNAIPGVPPPPPHASLPVQLAEVTKP